MINKRTKILIVDDKIENLIALEKILKGFDIEFVRALSGNEALAKTLLNEFALAIIDVRMPEMDGYETVKLMRQSKNTKYLPVIFVSAIYSEYYHSIKGIETAAVDFIAKPIIPEILREKVKVFLELYKQRKKLDDLIEELKKTNAQLKNEINIRKQTEVQLKKAKVKAEEADRLKSSFLANISHEIRTPMNAIIGFSDLLKEPNFSSEERDDFINIIINNGNILIKIIDDILDIARIEAGELKIEENQCPVNKILSELLDSFNGIKIKEGKNNIEIRVNKAVKEPNFSITTDPYRFRQVMTNLIGNSLKYTNKGFIEFGYNFYEDKKYAEIKEQNIMLRFYVKDTGIGISKDKQKIIFDRFRQADNSFVRKYGGTGLGLSITKNIVELLGGEIWLKSKLGKGSTFYFTLPYNPISYNVNNKQKDIDRPPKVYDWKNKTILIVEDIESNYELVKKILSKTKANVLWATNGKQAVEICKSNKNIDLILMDIRLPQMDGYEATKLIKQFRKGIKIIAETAYVMAENQKKAFDVGCIDYIKKPLNSKELLLKINKYINKK